VVLHFEIPSSLSPTYLQHVKKRSLASIIQSEEKQLGVLVQQPQRGEHIVDYQAPKGKHTCQHYLHQKPEAISASPRRMPSRELPTTQQHGINREQSKIVWLASGVHGEGKHIHQLTIHILAVLGTRVIPEKWLDFGFDLAVR
jgi:hypothetical protein